MDRRVQEDGTVIVGGQVVPTGGAQPTIASVVSYSGNAGLQSTNVEGALDELDNEKAPITHTHDDRYFTEVEVTNLLAGKAASSHTHDDRYFTEVEVTNLLAGKAALNHTHDDRYYTEAEVDKKISDALSSTSLHANAGFENVIMSTASPGDQGPVPERLLPANWGVFWTGGSAPRPPYAIIESDGANSRNNSGFSVRVNITQEDLEQSLDTSVFAVTPGSLVRFSVWTKGAGPGVYISILTRDGTLGDPDWFASGTQNVDSPTVIPGASWQQITHTMTVPSNHTRCRVKIRSFANSSGGNAAANPGNIWFDDSETSLTVIPPSGVVTGEIKMWPTASAPSGYLLCNGGTFSSDNYPVLAALLGDTFGTHVGTSYYLPDFRGRSPVGVGSAVPAVGGNVYSMGQKHGDERLQSHNHTQAAHSHSGQTGNGYTSFMRHVAAPGTAAYPNHVVGIGSAGYVDQANTYDFAGASHIHFFNTDSQTPAINNTGGGSSGNVHPVLGINYIIKAA